ncbi:putative ribonuclease H-like domain-containing protein [Tanacetum coccineum]
MNSARPMTNVFNKAHSTVRRPINKNITFKNSNFNQRVNTVKDKNVNNDMPKAVVNAVRPKAVLNVVNGNHVSDVKASACWVWKPKTKVIDHGNPQQDLKEKGVIDSGCSRHMTGNISYLIDFEEINGGYVAFGGNPKGGKITGKGSLGVIDRRFSRHMTGNMSYLTDYEDIDGGYVAIKGNPKGGKITCRVVTDDYSRFSWVFFLATKDETSGILKSFITRVENLIDQRVKVIRYDNGTEFKNKEMNQLYERKCIKREFSVARTPQQNRVAERKNRTLIEAARTMLANSKLPTTFWDEAINTACYVQNRVLVIKPHNKTPYELFLGKKLALSFMRPFGCLVTILNTIDHLGKFDSKADEGFFVGYSINSKAFRVQKHVMIQSSPDAGSKPSSEGEKKVDGDPSKEDESNDHEKDDNVSSTNNVNTASDGNSTNNVSVVSSTINVAGIEVNVVDAKSSIELLDDLNMPELEDIVHSDDDEGVGAEADMNNLDAFMPVSPIPTKRVHKDHPVEQIIGDLNSAPQTRRMTKNLEEHGLFS